jgi:hypothetical protein
VYDKKLTDRRRIRREENVETNWIISALRRNLCYSPKGIRCRTFVTHEPADRDITRVSIMENGVFHEWLKRKEQNFIKTGDADMDNQALCEQIDGVSNKIRYLQQDITALQYFDLNDNEGYSNLLNETTIKGEFIVLKLRQLVFDTIEIPKRVYFSDTANALDINVTENSGIVEITIPCLLPWRKSKPTDFIIDPLQEILSCFVDEWQPHFERFEHCVICFTHVYDAERFRKWGTRDHDNIEIKPIIDSINLFLLTDDAGSLCNIYNSSEVGESNLTRISIMKQDMFPEWILTQKGMS